MKDNHFTPNSSDSDDSNDESSSSESESETATIDKPTKGKQERKAYERQGKESNYQEDTEYEHYKNKKLLHLDHRD
jgi:hypothetical protein